MNKNLLEKILKKLKQKGCDQADVVFAEDLTMSSSSRLGKIEKTEFSEIKEIGIRAIINKKQSIVSSSNIEENNINDLVEKVVEMAKVVPEDEYCGLAEKIETEKKLKSFKKDLSNQFASKIAQLKELALNQEKFNSIISQLISDMSLDENIEDEEKRDDDNERNDNQSKPQNNEQKTKDRKDENEEMSIENGVPDLENDQNKIDFKFEEGINNILSALGEFEEVYEEEIIDKATAISGSGPGYIFYFMESMLKSCKEIGIDENLSKKLIIKTFLGSAELAKLSEKDFEELKKEVTSPNGTTEAGLKTMTENNLGNAIILGIKSAYKRARELNND